MLIITFNPCLQLYCLNIYIYIYNIYMIYVFKFKFILHII